MSDVWPFRRHHHPNPVGTPVLEAAAALRAAARDLQVAADHLNRQRATYTRPNNGLHPPSGDRP